MHQLAARPFLCALRLQRPSLPTTRVARFTLSSSSSASQEPPAQKPSAPPQTPRRRRVSAKASLDPAGVYTPSEFVNLQLESPQVQQVVNELSSEVKHIYNTLREKLSKDNGHSDLLALNDIGEFLEQNGVDLDLPDVMFGPTNTEIFQDYANIPRMAEITYLDRQTNQSKTVCSPVDPISHLDRRDTLNIRPSSRNPYGPTRSSTSGTSSCTTHNLPMRIVKDFYQSILISRIVKQQTGKGKIMRNHFLVCVGNGNGLIGYGEAKDSSARIALQKARMEAVKNMDYVNRFEGRTLFTDMESTLGATRLVMRPLPVGSGLRCNPFLRQIVRAAGFKDISAKVWGSPNKLNVIKAAFCLIQARHATVGTGDGVGGKSVQMQGKAELERVRGES